MKNIFFLFFFLMVSLNCFAESEWQENWLAGLEFLNKNQCEDAKNMFDLATKSMSSEELKKNYYIIINRAHVNYLLEDFEEAITDSEKLFEMNVLSDQEKLLCGNIYVSALWKKGLEQEAVEIYLRYIASNPIIPKYQFEENRIIIRNVPQLGSYQKLAKSFLINKFCEKEENIHEYGNTWVVNITKTCGVCKESELNARKRRPEGIRACCNTCSTLAVSATAICSCLSNSKHPVIVLCKLSCIMFTEGLRQACEWCCYNGGIEDKCWNNFSTWKDDFHNENQNCPHPPEGCQ